MSRAERQAARWARQARSRANPPADALQNVGLPPPPPPKPASPRNIVLEIKDERRTADTSQAEAALAAHLRGGAGKPVQCGRCARTFGLFWRRHRCRRCDGRFCDPCAPRRFDRGERVCVGCYVPTPLDYGNDVLLVTHF